jgi:hypothetical protein
MATNPRSNVLSFPGSAVHGSGSNDANRNHPPLLGVGDGALALDSLPFEIDEEDPLVMTGGRHSDVIAAPDSIADMRLIKGEGRQEAKSRLFRLRDLHPMDCVIIAGFLLIAIAI